MVMSFTLTNTLNPLIEQIIFPVNPPNVTVNDGSKSRSFSPMGLGEVEMWRGRHPKKYTFSAFFPGAGRYGRPWAPITLWRPPADLVYQLESWMGNSVKLLFVVTDTEVSVDVKLVSVQRVWGNAYGDVTYQIEVHEARSIIIPVNTDPTLVVAQPSTTTVTTDTNTTGNNDLPGRDSGTGSNIPEGSNRGVPVSTSSSGVPEGTNRSSDATPATVTIKPGDTLTSIAITNNTTVPAIMAANPTITDPDVISVGQTVNIPGGQAPAADSPNAEGTRGSGTTDTLWSRTGADPVLAPTNPGQPIPPLPQG